MNELEFGKTYNDVLGSIKDQLANNLTSQCLELKLDKDTIRKIVFIAQATVDGTGNNAFPVLLKSCV